MTAADREGRQVAAQPPKLADITLALIASGHYFHSVRPGGPPPALNTQAVMEEARRFQLVYSAIIAEWEMGRRP